MMSRQPITVDWSVYKIDNMASISINQSTCKWVEEEEQQSLAAMLYNQG